MLTMPTVSRVRERGQLSQYTPTRKIAVVTLGDVSIQRVAKNVPGLPSGHEVVPTWMDSPPIPHTGPLTDEQFDRLRQYMATNLHSGFAVQEVLRLAQTFAEAMIKEQTFSNFPLQTGQLEYIAMLVRQVAETLAITPEQQQRIIEANSTIVPMCQGDCH